MANQVSVIDSNYCAPYYINLRINTEKDGATYDTNNNRIFYMKGASLTLHERRVLYDGRGKPIVTLCDKIMTMHGRRLVFKGESSDSSQLLFSVKRSSTTQSGMIKLEIFLANNTSESECDFRVHVCKCKSSCTVFAGESPQILATMVNNDGFNVLVYPNVDYAFIVTLLMIIDEKTADYSEFMDGVIKNSAMEIGAALASGGFTS